MLAGNRRLKFDGSGHETKFISQLKEDDDNLKMLHLIDPSQAMLNAEMQVDSRYKLTRGGADDYFRLVAPGVNSLSQFLFDHRKSGVPDAQASRLVATLVNSLITLRAEQLAGYKLICCDKRMEIDGCVSRRYVFVPNKTVYRIFRESAEFLGNSVGMFTAELYRREMLVVLLSKKELVPGMHVGVLCQNAETAGRAIRVALIYFDRKTNSWSVDQFDSDSRIRHVKQKQLMEKMMLASESLMRRYKQAKIFAEKLSGAGKRRLPGDIKAEGWDKQFRSFLLREAEDLHIPVERIDDVVRLVKRKQKYMWSDVYAACLYVADQRQLSGSISIRQLAKKLVEKVS